MEYNEINPTEEIAIKFGPDSSNWQASPEYNSHFLKVCQNIFYDKLNARGYLFVNDVLERLDLDYLPQGQLLGWLANGMSPTGDIMIWRHEKDHFVIIIQPEGFIWNKI